MSNLTPVFHSPKFYTTGLISLACFMIWLCDASKAMAQALVAPTISPTTGSYPAPQTIQLYAPAGTIYLTTDGTQPTSSSTPYSAPFTVSSPTQINAVTYQSGTYSPVTTSFINVDATATTVNQSGLQLWLSSDFGLVTSTGSPALVTKWVDLSGRNNNAYTSLGSQPTFSDSPTASVGFNGASQYLSLPSGFANFNAGATIFVVAQPSSLGSNARLFDLGNGSLNNNIFMSEPSSGSFDLHVVNGSTDSAVTASSAINLGRFQVLEGSYNGTNTATLFTNANQNVQSTSMQIVNLIPRTNNFIGQASGGGNYYAGKIAEVLLYSTQLSASQRTAIEAYLVQKYQTLSLTPSTPIISVPSGTLAGPAQVAIACQPGTATYFTTDGSTPTSSSSVYCGCPLTVNFSQTVKVISIMNGVSSSVASATYTLDATQWPAPNPSDTTPPTINLQLPVASQ